MAEHQSDLTKRLVREGLKPKAKRKDARGVVRLMAVAEGWVMARRPGCAPFVITEAEWLALEEAA